MCTHLSLYSKELKINSVNVNCWSERSETLKSKIALYGDLDIVCLSETHLQRDENITLPGYKYTGLNRRNISTKTNRGSGGVGILVKTELLKNFTMKNV